MGPEMFSYLAGIVGVSDRPTAGGRAAGIFCFWVGLQD